MHPTLLRFLLVFGIAAVYGIVCRVVFALDNAQDWLQIVSMAFIYTMPFSLGALVCFLGYKLDKPGNFWAFAAPAISMSLILVGSLVFNIEAAICVLVALPVVVPCSILGGWVMSLILKKRDDKGALQLSCIVLLPFVIAPLEQTWESPHETRVMTNAIAISASPEKIWEQIYEVPAIQKDEIPAQWIYHLGFPRPLAAMIDKKGVGGMRHATFEGDVSFYEVVTHWEPATKLSFTIRADPEFIPRTAFDEHIIVGGRFYDVLDGTYEIERVDESNCVLHLSSSHRLSTRFNWYAGWWSEWVMDQIQGSILEVIRLRCERPTVDLAGGR